MASNKNRLLRTADVLETPRHIGYRPGMSATSLIGRKLARVYDVAGDVPGEMDAVLHRLDTQGGRHR